MHFVKHFSITFVLHLCYIYITKLLQLCYILITFTKPIVISTKLWYYNYDESIIVNVSRGTLERSKNMSKTYNEINKETIEKIKERCELKISQIDIQPENSISVAVRYAYNSILQIINESEG